MMKEEQEIATDDLVDELKDHREMKSLSCRNVPLQAFHDARATMNSLEKEVKSSIGNVYCAILTNNIHNRSMHFMHAQVSRLHFLLCALRLLTTADHMSSPRVKGCPNSSTLDSAMHCLTLLYTLRLTVFQGLKARTFRHCC
jgi:hypothetical protein